MKKKNPYIIFGISIDIILIIGIYLYLQAINNKGDSKTMIENSKVRKFNFKTHTVTLNSGYKIPLNGIGTYSLTGDGCYNAITSALNSDVR